MPFQAGTAYVQVLPSLRGFHTKINAELRTAFPQGLTINVVPKFDPGTMRAQADAAARNAGQTVRFKVDLDRRSLSDSIVSVALLGRALRTLTLPAALVAITPAALSAASALTQAAGAALLLPAGLVAGGVAAATLVVGLSGIGDALKQLSKADDAVATTAASSGKARAAAAEQIRSATDALHDAQRSADREAIQGAQQVADARRAVADAVAQAAARVRDAERDLADAQADAQRAQEDLTRARAEAREELQQLQFSIEGAGLAEEEAADRLEEARRRLAESRELGAGAEEISDLDREVRQADLSLRQASDRYRDLQAEGAEWAATGIEGSRGVRDAQHRVGEAQDGIRDATERLRAAQVEGARDVADAQRALVRTQQQVAWSQEDAARRVADAQRQLASAMAGTGDAANTANAAALKAAQAYARLSPAARNLVDTIRSLGPAWDAMRLGVQERLLTGVGDRVRALSNQYLPILSASLGSVATGFNLAFKQTSGFLETPGTVNDIAASMNNVTLGVRNASGAMLPLTRMFTDLFAVGSTFLPAIGQGFTDVANRAAAFVAHARETGQLRVWIQQGLDVLRQLGSIAMNVGSILFSSFAAARGSGESFLSMVDRVTGRVAAALRTPEGAGQLQGFFTTIRTVTGLFVDKLQQLWPVAVAAGGALAALLVAASPLSSLLFSLVTTALVPLLHAVEFLAPVLGPLIVLFGVWRAGVWLVTGALAAWRVATMLATAVSVAFQLAMGTNLVLTNAQAAAQSRFTVVKYAGIAATHLITAAQWLWNTSLWATIGSTLLMSARVATLAVIMGGYYVALGVARVATLAWAGTQWLLNAALSANPIGIVLVLLAALVGGVIWAWRNCETFRNIVLAVWEGIKTAFHVGRVVVGAVLDIIVAGLRMLGSFFGWVWTSVIQPVWNALGAGIRWVYDSIIQPAFNAIQGGLSTLRGWFDTIVNGIGGVWNRLREILAAPINFLINTVWNEGLLVAWNKVAEWIPGLPRAQRLQPIGFAQGGQVAEGLIRGPGTGTSDSIRAVTTSGMPLRVSDREYIMPADVTQRHYRFLEALREGQAEAIQATGGPRARGPRMAEGGAIGNAIRVARSMSGKRYVWGGGGAGGTDCSGYMAFITRALRMEPNPYRRIGTTHNFPWPGFAPGLRSAFGVGNIRGSHMRGNLAGVNVEAGGSHNTSAYGGPAKGVPYGQNFHLPSAGGVFQPGGGGDGGFNPIPGIIRGIVNSIVNPLINRLPTAPPQWMGVPRGFATSARDRALDMFLNFDNGGTMPPGYGLYHNGTGRMERVLTDDQWRSVTGRGDGDRHYHLTAYNAANSKIDLTAQFRRLELQTGIVG